jgi:4-amino-4-deoxy-L-arabinose transferase-like glycosyltransferase
MPADRDPGARDARWFPVALGGVAIVALAVRVTYVLVQRQDLDFGGDAYFYHEGANLLADGEGFISPYHFKLGIVYEAAEHPPLYLLYLFVPSLFGMTSVLTHLLWSCVAGTATVVVVGLVGRTVAGPRVGIVAAVIAAVYPGIWTSDGSLEAETLAMLCTAVTILLAYRYLERPTRGRIIALAVACAAAALTRSELMLLVPWLVVPLVVMTRGIPTREMLVRLGAGVVAFVVVVAPWVVFNLTRFERPVFLSAQLEVTLAGSNCDAMYYGKQLGYFSIPCSIAAARREGVRESDDQSVQAVAYRRAAFEYVRSHLSRVPAVVGARVGRVVGLYDVEHQLEIDELTNVREAGVARATLFGFYALALLSIPGVLILRRRGRPVLPLLAVVGITLVTVAITYGNTRFRTTADIALAVLAAVTVDAVIRRLRPRAPTPVRSSDEGTQVPAPV